MVRSIEGLQSMHTVFFLERKGGYVRVSDIYEVFRDCMYAFGTCEQCGQLIVVFAISIFSTR